MATLQSAMTIARYITNDTSVSSYAREDAELLNYGNNAIAIISEFLPGLFHTVVEITCVANTVNQTLNVSDSSGLVNILNVKNGNALTPTKAEVLDRFIPGWTSVAAATAENWIQDATDRFRFRVYPPAPTGQVLVGTHVAKPQQYTATATHNLPESFTPIIADYIVAMLDSKDDEYAVNGRAKMYLESFYGKLDKAAQ